MTHTLNSEADSLLIGLNSGDKVIVILDGQDKIVCPWAKIMTCWGLFQEEPPQDMVRIVNDGSVKTMISLSHFQTFLVWQYTWSSLSITFLSKVKSKIV